MVDGGPDRNPRSRRVLKAPGVYIQEKDAFPSSVVGVPTAVPAFVGYTQRDADGGRTLSFRPRRIGSLREFEALFGRGPTLEAAFTLTQRPPEGLDDARTRPVGAGPHEPVACVGGREWYLARTSARPRSFLYYGVKSFYENGGGPCMVVSIGSHADAADPSTDAFTRGIDALLGEPEPTLLVLPDAVLLPAAACRAVQEAAVEHCARTKSRFAILDVFRGYEPREDGGGRDCVADFRKIDVEGLGYAAAYYPWIETTLVPEAELDSAVLDEAGREALQRILTEELVEPIEADDGRKARLEALIRAVAGTASPAETANQVLRGLSPTFDGLLDRVRGELCRIPPSATMAGVYTTVDNTHGVWKAPANVSLGGVVRPTVDITHDQQEDLNIPPSGKAVNAIRSFPGQGVLVWGARTLDGNDLDGRYVAVRRTLIMLEQSIRLACRAYVFEPNEAGTWRSIEGMIEHFLTGVWKEGGLAGASPDDAFSVRVGLGRTMTAQDILDGILRVTVLVALTRPAEFLEITFQQAMET